MKKKNYLAIFIWIKYTKQMDLDGEYILSFIQYLDSVKNYHKKINMKLHKMESIRLMHMNLYYYNKEM